MKTIIVAALLLFSMSVLADKPVCNDHSVARCGDAPPGQIKKEVFNVPSPGTVSLVGLGVVGLVIARKRKK